PNCLGGLQVDKELDFRRLLDWEIGRFGAFEDTLYVERGSPVHVKIVGAVGHQGTFARSRRESEYGAKVIFECRSDNPASLRIRERTRLDDHEPRASLLDRGQRVVQLGYVGDAPRSKLQIACAGGSLGRMIAVFAVWPCRMPDVIDRVARSVQFPGNVHQLAAQVRKNIAEPGCVAARASQAVGQSHRNGIADAEKHDGNGRRLEPRSHRGARTAGNQQIRPVLENLGDRFVGTPGYPDDVQHDVPVLDQADLA